MTGACASPDDHVWGSEPDDGMRRWLCGAPFESPPCAHARRAIYRGARFEHCEDCGEVLTPPDAP
jgi:hypothetical protein